MNPLAISGLINSITSISLGFLVFFKDYKRPINRSYFLMSLSIAFWSFGYWKWQISFEKIDALLWVRVLATGSILIPIFYFYHILTLLGLEDDKKEKRILNLGYILCIIFLIFNLTPLFIKDVLPKLSFKYWPEPGLVYPFFLLTFLGYVIYACFLMIKSLKKLTGLRRSQIKYAILATIIGFGGGATNYPLWYDIPIYPIGNFVVFLYAVILTYAIVRYHLMDIHLVFKKTMTYSISAGLLTGLFIILVLILTRFLSDFTGVNEFKISIISALIIALLFNPLKNRIQTHVDKVFYKTPYDYYATVQKVSHELAATIELKDIYRFIVDTIFTTLKLKSTYLLSAESKYFETIYSRLPKDKPSDENDPPESIIIPPHPPFSKGGMGGFVDKDSELAKFLKNRNDIIIKEELPKIIEQDRADIIAGELTPFKGEAVVPVFIDNKLTSLLILGEKLSGDIFSGEDINLLNTISNQAAIAIKNATLYAEKIHAERLASIGMMAATLAHEIKNPLASIKVFAQLMPERYSDNEFRETFSRVVSDEIQRIDGLVTELLDFSKKTPIITEKVDIPNLLDNTLELFTGRFKKNNIHVIKRYDGPLSVAGNKKRLKQALINIIINSYQAMDYGGTLRVTTTFDNDYVNISIEDNGAGIHKNNIEKIFDPFFTTKQRGAGLGLAISKKITEDHGGKISVSSRVFVGTTFVLSLPSFKEVKWGVMNGTFSSSERQT